MPKRQQVFDPRQEMQHTSLEVFHNYDDKGRVVDLHHHDFYEVYYFLTGNVEYRVEGTSYTLQKGDLLLISPGIFHQPVVDPGTPYERYVLWIDRNYLSKYPELNTCFDPNGAVLLHPDPVERTALAAQLEELCDETRNPGFASDLYCHGLYLQILTRINRLASGSVRQGAPNRESPGLVNQVLAYIAAHYTEKLTLDHLAEHFFVSKYHLSHEFSSQVGTSVYRYILLKRILAAREMINAGVSPYDACHSCGFQDYANFYRAFKAEYGVSPKEYAQKYASK